jgi:hypothetical protein
MGNSKGKGISSFAKTGLQTAWNHLSPAMRHVGKHVGSAALNVLNENANSLINKGAYAAGNLAAKGIEHVNDKIFGGKVDTKPITQKVHNAIDTGLGNIRKAQSNLMKRGYDKIDNPSAMHMKAVKAVHFDHHDPGGGGGFPRNNSVQGLEGLTR